MEDKNKISVPMAIVAAGFLIMMGLLINKLPVKDNNLNLKNQVNQDTFFLTEIQNTDHIRGEKVAKVIIVEYSDTECPFCKNFHNIMIDVLDKYDGKVAWVYRHFPLDSLHSKARIEAEATECVASLSGNDAFWKYLDMIFEATPSNNGLDEALLPIFAERIGVNVDNFNKCLANGEFKEKVQNDLDNGIKAGATGTPYSVIITKDGAQIPLPGADEKKILETLEKLLK